ncbi:hypothetical protein KVT40_006816 [Elsinoe batatas]|uniref:Uncharacterized protein n=1 Tax=Elsinoe batatas TaxID=2601811 RepID=A0A8K0PAV9_9PEZI|nr:hypothetical protein KVT40_006816 [Elsinoe batatas]
MGRLPYILSYWLHMGLRQAYRHSQLSIPVDTIMPPKSGSERTSSKGVAKAVRKPKKKGAKQGARAAGKAMAATRQQATQQQPAQHTTTSRTVLPERIVNAIIRGPNNQDLSWTVHDPSPPDQNWNNGRVLSCATFPGKATRKRVGRTTVSYAQDEIMINVGDWISVKYHDKVKGQNVQSREFANVRAIRRVGTEEVWPMYTLLCVSWGYPLKCLTNFNRPRITGGGISMDLSNEDIVQSDVFDIIYLDNVEDKIDDAPVLSSRTPRFEEVIDTMDVAKFRRQDDHIVNLCTSRWMNKKNGTPITLRDGTIKREIGRSRRPGRIYDQVSTSPQGLPTRRSVMRR